MMHFITNYLWLLMIITGIFIRKWINYRTSLRRNAAGVEVFSSYCKAMETTFLERVGKFVGLLLIMIGIFKLFLDITPNKGTRIDHGGYGVEFTYHFRKFIVNNPTASVSAFRMQMPMCPGQTVS